MKKEKELSFCAPASYFHSSDSEAKMGDELTLLREVFSKIEKAGGQATLSVATVGGKTKMKLEIATTPAPSTESSSTSWPTGRCHRRRSPRARARRNQRAAAHQAALAEAAATAPPERSSASLLQCVPKKCYIAIWFC